MSVFNRIIKNGKLEVLAVLKGGPVDGAFVSADLDVIRLPIRRNHDELVRDFCNKCLPPPDMFRHHIYKRVSLQTYIYNGFS
jgi:hypothetical protein